MARKRRNKKMWMIVFFILLGLVDLGIIGLLVYEYVTTSDIKTSSITRAALIFFGTVFSGVKAFIKRDIKRSPTTYRKAYGDLIGNAFSEPSKESKQFFRALDDYNQEQYSSCLKRLESLSKEIYTRNERFSITVFSALCYQDMGSPKAAAEYYEAALVLSENSTVASNLGICYQNMGSYEMAADAYERAILYDGENPYPYSNLANLYLRMEEYERALTYAENALAKDAGFRPAHTAKAVALYMLGNREDYEKALRQAVIYGEDPKRVETLIQRLSI